MRASFITVLAILFIAAPAFVACERDKDDDGDDLEERIRSPQDDLEGVVVFGGDLEITIDELDEAVHRLRLLAPGVEHGQIPDGEPDWMKNPMAQINVVRNLLRFRVVRQAAADRELELSVADETAFLAEHEQLGRYLPLLQNGDGADALRQELEAVDLSLDDVRHLVHDMVLEEKLKEALAQEFSRDKLWGFYQQVYDEADLIVASTANTPKSHEIDRAIEQYDAEIRTEYRKNRAHYARPRQVEGTLVKPQSEEVAVDEIAQRLEDGQDVQKVAEAFDALVESGISLTPKVDHEAHQADEGEVGVAIDSPRGPHVWIIDEAEDSRIRELDRPLRREIGSQILREQEGITPANREQAQKARDILADIDADGALSTEQIEPLVKRLQQEGYDAVHTDFFSVHGSGVLPQIGLAEELFDAVGELELDDPVTEPILDRNNVYVARLVARNQPDRDAFDEEYEDFRKEFLEANRHRLVDDFVQNYQLEQEVNFHLAAVSERYGVMDHEKEGMERPAPPEEPIPAEELMEIEE